jgi:hypothetical protein
MDFFFCLFLVFFSCFPAFVSIYRVQQKYWSILKFKIEFKNNFIISATLYIRLLESCLVHDYIATILILL